MRTYHVLGVLAAIAMATGASAQVTSVVTSGQVTTTPSYSNVPPGTFPLGSVNNVAYQINGSSSGTPDVTNNYQISGLVTSSDIEFADNTTSQGYDAVTTATSTVTVNYTNGGTKSVTPTLQSTIVPGGFGFYVDQPASSDINQSPQAVSDTFASFNGYANPAATASFSFDIYSGSDTDASHLVASFSDSLTLSLSVGGYTVTAGTAPALNGFGLVTPAGSDVAVGYQWNATTVNVPLGVTLAPTESGQLTYVSSVTTSTFGEIQCGSGACASILSYAGFGDPVAKDAGGSGSADPYFALLELGLPTFDPSTGKVQQTLLPTSLPSLPLPDVTPAAFQAVPEAVLGVPEPGAWALMLAGFGLVGAASRRRQRLA